MDETAQRVSKIVFGQAEIRYVHGVPALLGQQHVVRLIAEHRDAQHRHAVISGLDCAVYAAVSDEQLTVGMTCIHIFVNAVHQILFLPSPYRPCAAAYYRARALLRTDARQYLIRRFAETTSGR